MSERGSSVLSCKRVYAYGIEGLALLSSVDNVIQPSLGFREGLLHGVPPNTELVWGQYKPYPLSR
jgi:hypothetical protein